MDNVKIAKELVKIAKNLVAEGDIKKYLRMKNELVSGHDEYEKLKQEREKYINFFKDFADKHRNDAKMTKDMQWAITCADKGYYESFRVPKKVPCKNGVLNGIKWFAENEGKFNHFKDCEYFVERVESNESLFGKARKLLTEDDLPAELKEAFDALKEECVEMFKEKKDKRISKLKEYLDEKNLCKSVLTDVANSMLIRTPNAILKFKKKMEEYCKQFGDSCRNIEDVKRVLNDAPNQIDGFVVSPSFDIESNVESDYDRYKSSYEKRLRECEQTDEVKQGESFYTLQKNELLGELSEYCDDILDAYGLEIAENGQFNIRVKATNGIFQVRTSYVSEHIRYLSNGGETKVQAHWRLTVRQIKNDRVLN